MRPAGRWLGAATPFLLAFVGLVLPVARSASPATVDLAVQQTVIGHRSPGLAATSQAFTSVGTPPIVVGTTLTCTSLTSRTRSSDAVRPGATIGVVAGQRR